MKLLLVPLLLTACVNGKLNLTDQQKTFVNQRVIAAAASRGVTPEDSKAVLNLLEK